MKRILYLSFYFEPDLSAGSFRNTTLVKELARQTIGEACVDIFTTMPNRYSTFHAEANEYEVFDNIELHRIKIPKHQSGMKDQIISFNTYYKEVKRMTKNIKFDLVVASSSRLFTAYLGYSIAKRKKIPLYLDIRDIFIDTMDDVLNIGIAKNSAMRVLRSIEKKIFNYASHINLISEGFKPYFEKYGKPTYSYYSNGIDDIFLEKNKIVSQVEPREGKKIITYAGNIGEGQGLHKIIPEVANRLKNDFHFIVLGSGSAKEALLQEISKLDLQNVELLDPVKREELISIYSKSDFLFLHLNDYDAFKKVLPSKIFELASFDKPIIAGVAGYANYFIRTYLTNYILFLPGDAEEMIKQLNDFQYSTSYRAEFINKFKRSNINKKMADSIKNYL